MKKEDIICLPNKNLRKKSARVHVITDDVEKLISDMKSATLDWEASRPHEVGAALAAVQVNDLRRVIVVRSEFEDKESQEFTTLINPEIVKFEGEIVTDFEGCLSVKDIYGKVPRHSKVRVKALDEDGNPIKFKAEGFLARVLQHEVDHNNGIVFVDHIKNDHEAFFKLDAKGELVEIDYEKEIKKSNILWD